MPDWFIFEVSFPIPNSSNKCNLSSSEIPIPVSSTVNFNSFQDLSQHENQIYPSNVNLREFEIRFRRICFRRFQSLVTSISVIISLSGQI